jgi:mannitol 2-dehydrogenase
MSSPVPVQPLNARTLPYWSERLPAPAYDRDLVTPGVVHFGVGGFHRAHQAMYHDRLMTEGAVTGGPVTGGPVTGGTALDWGICGVGVMPADRRMQEVLDAQDCLYTLVLKHSDGKYEPRVIGSIVEYLFAPEDPEAVIKRLAAESTRIVSLTVTEGGYNVDDVTGKFDVSNPAVLRDLEPNATPRTIFGLITEALSRRRRQGITPFTVMSCDNLQGNGQLSRRAFTAFARLKQPELADWIRSALVRGCRGPARRAGGALRAHEAAFAQRQPSGHVLLRLPDRLPAGARGCAGPAVPRVPARLHARGGVPYPSASTRGGP